MFESMEDVRAANESIGHHWFEPSTLRFFRSRIGQTLYGGRYFVTSEQFVPRATGCSGPRRYTIRAAKPSGAIETVGEFQQYETSEQARRVIKQLLGE